MNKIRDKNNVVTDIWRTGDKHFQGLRRRAHSSIVVVYVE